MSGKSPHFISGEPARSIPLPLQPADYEGIITRHAAFFRHSSQSPTDCVDFLENVVTFRKIERNDFPGSINPHLVYRHIVFLDQDLVLT
jgi:hypothetical protein